MYHCFRSLLFTAALLGAAGLSSCSKEEVAPTSATAQLLVGQWQLTAVTNDVPYQSH